MKITLPCSSVDEVMQDIYKVYYPVVPRFNDLEFEIFGDNFCEQWDEVIEQQVKIRELLEVMRVQITTHVAVSPVWTLNMWRNIRAVNKSCNAGVFFNCHKEKPMIVASAGPSLTGNIREYKDAGLKIPIVCVGTSLKPLLMESIEPDFCVSIDAHLKNAWHFDGLEWNGDCKTKLIYDPMIHPDALKKFKGKKYVANANGVSLWGLWEQFMVKVPLLASGFSVATTAISFAAFCGASPIILIGQDLAYGADGQTHAEHTFWRKEEPLPVSSNVRLKSWDEQGEVSSSPVFLSILRYIEDMAREFTDKLGIQFVNATGGGAHISGMEHKRLDYLNLKGGKTQPLEYLIMSHPFDFMNTERFLFVMHDAVHSINKLKVSLLKGLPITDSVREDIKRCEQFINPIILDSWVLLSKAKPSGMDKDVSDFLTENRTKRGANLIIAACEFIEKFIVKEVFLGRKPNGV